MCCPNISTRPNDGTAFLYIVRKSSKPTRCHLLSAPSTLYLASGIIKSRNMPNCTFHGVASWCRCTTKPRATSKQIDKRRWSAPMAMWATVVLASKTLVVLPTPEPLNRPAPRFVNAMRIIPGMAHCLAWAHTGAWPSAQDRSTSSPCRKLIVESQASARPLKLEHNRCCFASLFLAALQARA